MRIYRAHLHIIGLFCGYTQDSSTRMRALFRVYRAVLREGHNILGFFEDICVVTRNSEAASFLSVLQCVAECCRVLSTELASF